MGGAMESARISVEDGVTSRAETRDDVALDAEEIVETIDLLDNVASAMAE